MTILKTQTSTLGALSAVSGVLDVSDADFMSVQITGTFVGTLNFQASLDNITFFQFAIHQSANATSTADVVSATTTFLGYKSVWALRFVRVEMIAYTSGSAVVTLSSSRSTK